MKARVCRKCWGIIVEAIGNGKERCRICGHEQEETPSPQKPRI